MAAEIKHKKVSEIADSADPDIIQPSDWNDDHEIAGLEEASNVGVADVNFNSFELKNFAIEEVDALPSPAIEGRLVKLIGDRRLYFGFNNV